MSRIFVICILLFFSNHIFSQDLRNFNKIKKYYTEKKYEKAAAKAEQELEKNKKLIELWYIKAASEYYMSKMPKYADGKINYFKKAIKSAIRATDKDTAKELFEDYAAEMVAISTENNKEAIDAYYTKNYNKSLTSFKYSWQLSNDTIAYGYIGLNYFKTNQMRDAKKYLTNFANWNFGAFSDSVHLQTLMKEPFEALSNLYISIGEFDSAMRFTEMGLEIFKLNPILRKNMKQLLQNQLSVTESNEGYTKNYYELINKSLRLFNSDTFFLSKQNAYYINNLKGATNSRPFDEADSLAKEFYTAKQQLIKTGSKNATDVFLTSKKLDFYFLLLDYFLRKDYQNAAGHFFKRYYESAYSYPRYDEALAMKLLNKPPDNISRKLIIILFEDAAYEYPKNKNIPKYRSDFFNTWIAKKYKSSEIPMVLKLGLLAYESDKTIAPKIKSLLKQSFDTTAIYGEIYSAWNYLNMYEKMFPTDNTNAMHEILGRTDFLYRFYATKIDTKIINGKKVALTGWDGNSIECYEGQMPDTTLTKVIDRINYFRQQSGIKSIMKLSMDKVQLCQLTSTMFATKGLLSREPTAETFKCFSRQAVIAAKIGQAILEPNPAQCVTIFMDDKKANDAINRRSILNPQGIYIGFGASENNSVFWLLDTLPVSDSNYYKNNLICWPPQVNAPNMLVFKKFSFSAKQNFINCSIQMKLNGKTVETKQNIGEGKMYLQTLIVEPDFDVKKLKEGDVVEATIKLKNGRIFNYKTKIFNAKDVLD